MCVGQQSDVELSKRASVEQSFQGEVKREAGPVRTVSSRMKNLMRDELLINVRKFETQV